MENFASDGATTPWHGNATYSAAIHDSTGGRTWVAWEAFVDGARRVHCTVLDVTAGAFGPIHDVAAQPLQDDDHGVPAIVMDHEGYVHCFHGPHDGEILVHSTAAANDPAACLPLHLRHDRRIGPECRWLRDRGRVVAADNPVAGQRIIPRG